MQFAPYHHPPSLWSSYNTILEGILLTWNRAESWHRRINTFAKSQR